jgi:hypothetical protein
VARALVVGRWSLVVGRWSLVVGRWSLVVGVRASLLRFSYGAATHLIVRCRDHLQRFFPYGARSRRTYKVLRPLSARSFSAFGSPLQGLAFAHSKPRALPWASLFCPFGAPNEGIRAVRSPACPGQHKPAKLPGQPSHHAQPTAVGRPRGVAPTTASQTPTRPCGSTCRSWNHAINTTLCSPHGTTRNRRCRGRPPCLPGIPRTFDDRPFVPCRDHLQRFFPSGARSRRTYCGLCPLSA